MKQTVARSNVVPFRGPAPVTAAVPFAIPDDMKHLFDGQTWACGRGEEMFVVSRAHSVRDEWNWWFRDNEQGIDITTYRPVRAVLVAAAIEGFEFRGCPGWHVNEEVFE